MELTGKTVTILGGQRSGAALAKLVVRLGGKAGISETRDPDCVPEFSRGWAAGHNVRLEFGGHTREFVEDSDWVVLSPGVPAHIPAVQWAKDKKIPVLGEIEFAFQFCRKPVIAVTGSNGKTTVVTLIHQVLEAAGKRSCLCGNIGAPFSDHVLELAEKDYVVLETSSFQLETVTDPAAGVPAGVRGFKPYIAVILNVNQNHLDRHKDFQEYFDAKQRIFLNQDQNDYAVLNARDGRLREAAGRIKSQVRYFEPSWMPLAGVAVNANYAAVWEVVKILGVKENVAARVFREFKGVEHRLELVREINGVHFINDSKATTAEAAIWALERLNTPVVMICGGRDKHIDFSVVTPWVRRKVKRMIVIGEARDKLKKTFAGVVEVDECATLPEAVARAGEIAGKGDSVLLSPMCASFDMFANYEERGRTFKQIVNGLVLKS